ncbi:MAG: hypothetical protein IH847_01455 [Acidobacteria bacterium]|nr:hypothetical protein [Acidobacteriota bacterium]
MLKAWIHSIERAHWARENRRVTYPFEWGIEHLGGDPARDDPRQFLQNYSRQALEGSESFFATEAAEWYKLDGDLLRFPSAIESSFPENNTVHARWFPAERPEGRAVLLLPPWNAQPESHVSICRFLRRFGVSALRLSLPYHDQRQPAGYERADPMVSPNLGLTLQASRQAVLDARRAVRWLEQQGYTRIGILGTSIGSSVSYITLAHEPALRAGVFLHVSTYFADVVSRGMLTSHVWEGLASQVSAEELRQLWMPISPFPYVGRLRGREPAMLLVSARYDLTFPFDLSRLLWERMEELSIPHQLLILPCGHYTLANFPFSWWAGLRFIPFLRRVLA